MKKQQLTSFYLEALLLVAVFVAVILVLTGVFGAARAQSVKAQRLTQAVTLASNAAEIVSLSDSPEQAASLLDKDGSVRLQNGRIEASYAADGSPCPDGSGALLMTVTWEPAKEDGAFVLSRISVYAEDRESPIYTLETARFGREATS